MYRFISYYLHIKIKPFTNILCYWNDILKCLNIFSNETARKFSL